jgi:acetyl esterase/lipase
MADRTNRRSLALRVRGVASVVFGTLLGLLTVSMYAPMPLYGMWVVRFATREAALLVTALAVVAALLSSSRRGRVYAVVCGLLSSLPLFSTLPLFFRHQVSFSLREYVSGVKDADVTIRRDIILDPERADLRVDQYEGRGPAPHPFVIVIHGGSWQRGDKGDVPQVSRHLAAAGITVFDLRYRLSPAHRFPAAVQDVKCALGRLRQKSAELGIDANRAGLLGRSAGGQIALVAGYSTGEARLPPGCEVPDAPVQSIVAIYPFTELRAAHETPPFPDPEDTRPVMEAHLGGTPTDQADAYARATASTYVAPLATRPLPSTLFLHGSADMLVPLWHSQRLDAALRAASQPTTFVPIPLAEHGFDFRPGGAGEQLERALATRFLHSGRL